MPVPAICPRCTDTSTAWVHVGDDKDGQPCYLCSACGVAMQDDRGPKPPRLSPAITARLSSERLSGLNGSLPSSQRSILFSLEPQRPCADFAINPGAAWPPVSAQAATARRRREGGRRFSSPRFHSRSCAAATECTLATTAWYSTSTRTSAATKRQRMRRLPGSRRSQSKKPRCRRAPVRPACRERRLS